MFRIKSDQVRGCRLAENAILRCMACGCYAVPNYKCGQCGHYNDLKVYQTLDPGQIPEEPGKYIMKLRKHCGQPHVAKWYKKFNHSPVAMKKNYQLILDDCSWITKLLVKLGLISK